MQYVFKTKIKLGKQTISNLYPMADCFLPILVPHHLLPFSFSAFRTSDLRTSDDKHLNQFGQRIICLIVRFQQFGNLARQVCSVVVVGGLGPGTPSSRAGRWSSKGKANLPSQTLWNSCFWMIPLDSLHFCPLLMLMRIYVVREGQGQGLASVLLCIISSDIGISSANQDMGSSLMHKTNLSQGQKSGLGTKESVHLEIVSFTGERWVGGQLSIFYLCKCRKETENGL